MRWIFELKENSSGRLNREQYDKVRRAMLCHETTINTIFPDIRVHVSEDENNE